jgi:hypothetical protein
MHLGTNDLWGDDDTTMAIHSTIISYFRDDNPSVIILLAQIIPVLCSDSTVQEFNKKIAELAEEKHTERSPVILVDHYTGFDVEEDTEDGCHPDSSGNRKMAQRWFDALRAVLPPPDTTQTYAITAPYRRERFRYVDRSRSGAVYTLSGRHVAENWKKCLLPPGLYVWRREGYLYRGTEECY